MCRAVFSAALILVLAIKPALAQSGQNGASAATQTSARPAAKSEVDPNSAVNAALRIAGMADRNQLGELWDGASSMAKRAVERKAFVGGVANARAGMGMPASRHWISVQRVQSDASGKVPSGLFLSVQFETRFANGKVMHELVSLRLDEDGVWRFTGYSLK